MDHKTNQPNRKFSHRLDALKILMSLIPMAYEAPSASLRFFFIPYQSRKAEDRYEALLEFPEFRKAIETKNTLWFNLASTFNFFGIFFKYFAAHFGLGHLNLEVKWLPVEKQEKFLHPLTLFQWNDHPFREVYTSDISWHITHPDVVTEDTKRRNRDALLRYPICWPGISI